MVHLLDKLFKRRFDAYRLLVLVPQVLSTFQNGSNIGAVGAGSVFVDDF